MRCDSRLVHFVSNHKRIYAVNGIWEFMSDSFRSTWHPEEKVDDMTVVDCVPSQQHYRKFRLWPGNTSDFLSLDVEGAEYEVIKTLDFRNVQFGIIFYEADSHNFKKNHANFDIPRVSRVSIHGYILS